MPKINPFVVHGYNSPKYFCDRNKESMNIISAMNNQRNLTLFSLRKIGKTGLIHDVFYKMKKKNKKDGFIYADISPADNLQSFIKIIAQEIIKQLESKPLSMIKEAALMLKSIRPKLSVDSVTGEPSLSVFFESKHEAEASLVDTLEYLKKRSEKQRICMAIDEFQQILNFPEKNIEAILRSHIQFMNNVNFIFSGSEQRMMISIFADAKHPFYQSTQMMHLEKISAVEYKEFIRLKFNESNINIEDAAIELILDLTRDHTYYVQYLCNNLFDRDLNIITITEVNNIFTNILLENESTYYGYRKILPEQQWKLTKAIALDTGAEHLTSKDFLKKYDLGSHSSVSAAIKALLTKDIVYEEKGIYYVYDVFFSRWLERL